jgi:hypothetical protein
MNSHASVCAGVNGACGRLVSGGAKMVPLSVTGLCTSTMCWV